MFKSVIGFNSRFTQGVVGEANLLSAAAPVARVGAGTNVEEGFVVGAENATRFGIVAGEKGEVNGTMSEKKVSHIDAEGRAKLLKVVSEVTGVDLSALGL